MIKIIIAFFFSLFLLISCSKTTKPEVVSNIDSTSVKTENSYSYTPTYFDYKNTRMADEYSETTFAKFSNDSIEDSFTLYVPKGLITETKTTIRITTKKGGIIYEHIFPTSDLVNGYATEKIKSDLDMEKYILSEVKSFLKEALYDPSELAKNSYLNQAPKEDFNNYDVFENIKNTDKVMFHYCLNEESHYYLGYSEKQEKVVDIIDCC